LSLETATDPKRRLAARARTQLSKPMMTLRPGTAFGEDVMFFNAEHPATFRASEADDVELYVVARQDYMLYMHHGGERYVEWCDLLEEAGALSTLFQSQRHELAAHARGYQRFDRGAMVVKQGRRKESPLLYVVAAGSGRALLPTRGSNALAEVPLRRGDVFGERPLSNADSEMEGFSVRAGDQDASTLTCLCIDISLLNGFGVSKADLELILSPANLRESPSPSHAHGGSRRTLLFDSTSEQHLELKNLEPVSALGSGGFGFVTLQRDRQTKRFYALKRISKGLIPPTFYENICAERDLMELADSKFIIRYICSYRDASFLYILLEAALGGDLNSLRDHLWDFGSGANDVAMFYVACIVAGLEHLHQRHVLFRDLKPENALLDSNGYAKLCDLGMARFVFGKTYTFCGTPEYMAPEILRCSGHEFAVDWWALGIMIVDLLGGTPPWQLENGPTGAWIKDLLTQQKKGVNPAMIPDCPGSLKLFLQDLLVLDPAKRLGGGGRGACQVRDHVWFREASFDFDALHSQDCRTLAPPVRPEAFKLPTLPLPDFTLDIPTQMRENRVVGGGRSVREERMELQTAVALLQGDDTLDGLYTRTPGCPGEEVFVFFVQQRGAEPMYMDERPMWVAYLKERSLYEPYKEGSRHPDWDASFALPPALCVARDA